MGLGLLTGQDGAAKCPLIEDIINGEWAIGCVEPIDRVGN
jgi:hypothetical protein